jgi:hypothetical protein
LKDSEPIRFTRLEEQLAREAIKKEKADGERAELQDTAARAMIRLAESLAPQTPSKLDEAPAILDKSSRVTALAAAAASTANRERCPRRGPLPDMERHRAILAVVEQFRPEWKPQLDKICQILDQRGIAPSLAWQAKKQARKARSWDRAAEYYPQRVVKAIERSVEMARRSL